MSLRTFCCWLAGTAVERLVEEDFVVDFLDHLAGSQHGVLVELFGADVVGEVGAGVADDGVGRDVVVEDLLGLLGDGGEGLDLAEADRVVEGVGGGHGADQDEHDQAHALLAVVGAVTEADAGAGEDEQGANPERRRLGALRRLDRGRCSDGSLRISRRMRRAEADQRRNQQDFEDAAGLLPVDAAGAGLGIHELVGDADADDGTDEGVGAGSGQAEPPGAEVPDDGGDEEGEDHGEAGALADLEDQLDGQQGEDREGHRAGGSEHADEVPHAGPDDGDVRLERVGVDDGGDGVGGVVKAVDRDTETRFRDLRNGGLRIRDLRIRRGRCRFGRGVLFFGHCGHSPNPTAARTSRMVCSARRVARRLPSSRMSVTRLGLLSYLLRRS